VWRADGGTISSVGLDCHSGKPPAIARTPFDRISDDAGQFRVGIHALRWVHAERLVHKLVPATSLKTVMSNQNHTTNMNTAKTSARKLRKVKPSAKSIETLLFWGQFR
jgi:hypothetical protein